MQFAYCGIVWIHYGFRAAERLAGARGKLFLGDPISKFFPKKIFFGEQPTPPPTSLPVDNFLGKKVFRTSTLQMLSRDFISIFHTKFRYLAQKNLALCAEIFNPQTNDWGPTKISRGPQHLGARGNPPPAPSYRRPCMDLVMQSQISYHEFYYFFR